MPARIQRARKVTVMDDNRKDDTLAAAGSGQQAGGQGTPTGLTLQQAIDALKQAAPNTYINVSEMFHCHGSIGGRCEHEFWVNVKGVFRAYDTSLDSLVSQALTAILHANDPAPLVSTGQGTSTRTNDGSVSLLDQ